MDKIREYLIERIGHTEFNYIIDGLIESAQREERQRTVKVCDRYYRNYGYTVAREISDVISYSVGN